MHENAGRDRYDVWGDTVNVVSRMESSGEAGRIHCSEAFAMSLAIARDDNDDKFSVLSSEFSVHYRGETEIKGKGKMKTYWLEGA